MKITPVSLFLVFFAAGMLGTIMVQVRRERMGMRSALVWFVLWIGIGLFSLFPDLLDGIISLSHMKERMIFVLLVAVFVLLGFIFNLSSKYDLLQRNMQKITQELAMTNYRIDRQDRGKEPPDTP